MHFNGTHTGRSFRAACRPSGEKHNGKWAQFDVTEVFDAIDCGSCRVEVMRERIDRVNQLADKFTLLLQAAAMRDNAA